MVYIFPFFLYPYYIKKEDAKNVWRNKRIVRGLLLLSFAVVAAIMRFFVVPNLFSLYSEINEPIPSISQITSYVLIIAPIILVPLALYFFFIKPDYSKLDQILSKYKEGEMIKTSELVKIWDEFLILIFGFVVVGFVILGLVLPIYDLTAKLG